jgi:nucleoside-diphosphate-sugar epimerase
VKSILVTGGSGYIGRLTLPWLHSEGYAVDNYDIAIDPQDDIWNIDRLQKRMRGKDVVYHLVAIPHPHKGNEIDYRRMNYAAAVLVFEQAKTAGVKKFVFPSSGCVYGFWGGHAKPDKLPITEENAKPTLKEGQTLYGYFKLAFEDYLREKTNDGVMKAIALRIEGVNRLPVLATSLRMRWLPEHKPEEQSCKLYHFLGSCSVENYCQLLELVIEKDLEPHFEVFNVGNDSIHPSIDVQQVIREHWPNIPNETTGNQALYSVDRAKRLLGYQPSVPAEFNESGATIPRSTRFANLMKKLVGING